MMSMLILHYAIVEIQVIIFLKRKSTKSSLPEIRISRDAKGKSTAVVS